MENCDYLTAYYIEVCLKDTALIAGSLFGSNNNHYKTLIGALHLSMGIQTEILLEEIDLMINELEHEPAMKEVQKEIPPEPINKLAQRNTELSDRAEEGSDTEKGNVFIVHGHNDYTKEMIADFLKELGLRPIILHEQPNKGRTIIEKFEDHSSNAEYAVVLLTPDDVGALKSESNQLSPRARQNVVFEMGHFFGSLGRGKVCALLCPDVERPSDIDGIVYIILDKDNNWKHELTRELKAAGLNVEEQNSDIESRMEISYVAAGTGLSDAFGRIRPL